MTEPQPSWAFVGISPEARQAAELAAEAAGMELDTWLAQLIKYKATMELKGRDAVPLDDAIMQLVAPGNGAAAEPAEAEAPAAETAPETAAEPDGAPEARTEPEGGTEPEGEMEPEGETGPEAGAAPETAPEAVAPPVAGTPPEPEASPEAVAEPAPEPAAAEEDDRQAELEPAEEAETVVLSTPETPTEVRRPQADNDSGPEIEAPDTPEPAAAAPKPAPPPVPAAAAPHPPAPEAPVAETPVAEAAVAEAAAEAEPEPSPRKSLPTEALRPSRLSALNQASEDAIQGAFDAWRDSRTLEPLLVRPSPDERNVFEVIVGIERWHAARRAHIRELPVLVHEATDEEAIRLAMSARLKRGPLSPLAEAAIYLSLMSEASMSTEQVARMVGKPPAHVATMVRVLNLPRAVRDMLERGELTALHARALLDAPNAEALAREVIAKRLDIYQTEQLVRTAMLKAERAEKVDLDAVDIDLGGGELSEGAREEPAPAVDTAALDGEIGFGPEARIDRESFGAAAAGVSPPQVDDTPPFEAPESDLVFDDEVEDNLDLIDAPEIEEETVTIPAPPMPPFAAKAKPDDKAAPAGGPSQPDSEPRQKTEAADKPQLGEKAKPEAPALPGPKKGVVTTELLEHHLSHLLGLKVSISESHNMGVISIHYTDREELSDVVSRLNSGSPG